MFFRSFLKCKNKRSKRINNYLGYGSNFENIIINFKCTNMGTMGKENPVQLLTLFRLPAIFTTLTMAEDFIQENNDT